MGIESAESTDDAGYKVRVLLGDSVKYVEPGMSVASVLPGKSSDGRVFIGACVNNDVVSLSMPITYDCTLRGLTASDPDGWLIIRSSMCFLLAMAASRAFPTWHFRIHHTVASGLFFMLCEDINVPVTLPSTIEKLGSELRSITDADMPIERRKVGYEEAIALFAEDGRHDKVGILRHINKPSVGVITCGGFTDLHHNPVVSSTGMLKVFSLCPYEDGCVMNLPDRGNPSVPMQFREQKELMRVHRQHSRWGEILGVRSAGELNQAVYERRIVDIIMMSEALHNRNLAELAGRIAACSDRVRLVLIAGPSSAGKTTSAKRLQTHMRVDGLNPVMLSTDDYFVGDDKNPIGPDGLPDYEHIDALDLDEFNRHLGILLDGGTIKRRVFDFKAKHPVTLDEDVTLGKNGILIVEGIHGLNPQLTSTIPRERKFMIYLSALTQLGIDNNTFVSSSDNRLVRRLVRDHLFRGHSAKQTIRMWPGVRRGEERWIFPYQDSADVSFNTALDYELAVLRPFVDPLLADIKPADPEYAVARRLQGTLKYFHPILPTALPGDSILREYIGGSLLKY